MENKEGVENYHEDMEEYEGNSNVSGNLYNTFFIHLRWLSRKKFYFHFLKLLLSSKNA